MPAVFNVAILLAIIQPCFQFSIDRLLLKALEREDEIVPNAGRPEAAELRQQQNWKDYKIPEFNGTYVKLQIDMILPREEAEKAFMGTQFTRRKKRSGIRDKKKLWPNGDVPYSVDDSFGAEEKLKIHTAIQHWMQYTCLRFVPKSEKDYSFLKFLKDDDFGCLSFVGFQNQPQPIYLHEDCVHEQIIIHEIGHAVGLFHEHSRPDRDPYVTINYENIDTDIPLVNFDKGNWSVYDNYNKPYDYLSIMHYGRNYFSKDPERNLMTIMPKDPEFTNKIGNAQTISFHDAQIINSMYKCSGGCDDIPCPDEGFLGMDCKCHCPGTAENEPVTLCEQQDLTPISENESTMREVSPETIWWLPYYFRVFCKRPAIDPTVFEVYDRRAETRVLNLDKNFLNGTLLRTFFSDEKCEYVDIHLTCNNGSWDGVDDLPPCEYEPCDLPESWKSEDGKAAEDGQVSHGTQVSISCPKTRNAIMGQCEFGQLVNSETRGNIGEYWCCKDVVYRIVDKDARGCLVSHDNQLEYSLMQGGVRLREGDVIPHLQAVEAVCDNPDINNEFDEQDLRTTMKCVDGHWDNPPPLKCPKAASQPCSLVPNATLIGPFRNQNKGDTYSVECIPGYVLDTPQITKFTCTHAGEWEPGTPTCTYSSTVSAKKPCSLVISATVSETSSKNTFTVKCLPGYDLNEQASTQFSCAADGKWLPVTPFCKPRRCRIPNTYTGRKLETEGGVNVIAGMSVDNAVTVRPICSWGEVTTLSEVTCKLGEWFSAGKIEQSLPVCNKVVCAMNSNFPVNSTNMSSKTAVREYVFGDTIQLANQKCSGNLELVGPETLTCQRNGQWSGSIDCRKYCENGHASFKVWENKNMKAKAVDHVQFGNFKRRKCAKRCLKEKRFLCRAISFGYDMKVGYICYLYAAEVEGETSLIDQPDWVVAARGCKPQL